MTPADDVMLLKTDAVANTAEEGLMKPVKVINNGTLAATETLLMGI